MNETNLDPNHTVTVLWDSPYPIWFQVLLWVVMAALSVETIVGNLFVLIAYRLDRGIRKQINNRYIMSLAISDLVIGIEGFPFFTLFVVNGERWPLGPIACQTWLFLDYTLCLVSILTVLLITVDRYLSVCYTAKYLKWQSPTKVKWLIMFSWLMPAIFFAIMIYGWDAMTGEHVMDPTACYAPFLNDPYVNMTMYLVYYWSTLIAMLILYRGIHTTARNLEKKGEAREKRNIALLMGQRLGAQVGVTLLFQTPALGLAHAAQAKKDEPVSPGKRKPSDSGYTTETTAATHTFSPGDVAVPEALMEVSTPDDSSQAKTFNDIVQEKMPARHLPSGFSLDIYGSQISLQSAFMDQSLSSLLTLHMPMMPKFNEYASNGGLDMLDFDPYLEGPRSFPSVHKSLSNPIGFDPIEAQLFSKNSINFSSTEALLMRRIDSLSSGASFEQPLVHRALANQAFAHSSSSGLGMGNTPESSQLELKEEENEEEDQEEIKVTTPLRHKSSTQPLSHHSDSTVSEASDEVHRSRSETTISRGRRVVRVIAKKISVLNLRKSATMDKVRGSVPDSSTTKSQGTTGLDSPSKEHNSTGTPDLKELNEANEMWRNRKKESDGSMADADPPQIEENEVVEASPIVEEKHKEKEKEGLMHGLFRPILRRRRKKTKAEKRARKAFRTITFIVGAFGLFWSPYFIVATVYGFCPSCIPNILFICSYYMCYLNSSGNPFAYAMANRQFKGAFMRILAGNFKRT